jgi:hypothetical protein
MLAGAAVALIGGLVWAAVVIATRLDIGVLAWLIGAATGLAIARVAGGGVGTGIRVLAGGFSAAAIIVGKYVIFVHDVRKVFGPLLALQGRSVGYLDRSQMHIFLHHFGTFVRPIYALWVGLAFFAAYRTAGRGASHGR